jgi:hypothetical protein
MAVGPVILLRWRRMAADAMTNVDLLAWFAEDERSHCSECAERACVTLPNARASFCLSCGTITVKGERIDPARLQAA